MGQPAGPLCLNQSIIPCPPQAATQQCQHITNVSTYLGLAGLAPEEPVQVGALLVRAALLYVGACGSVDRM